MMYFSFSKQEYNGLMVLIVLIVVVTAMPALYARLWPDRANGAAEHRALQQLALVELAERRSTGRERVDKQPARKNPVLFSFDPNVIGMADWQQLGLSENQASSILKYRAKGGTFRTAGDLRKMYTISGDCYERLAPFIRIDTVVLKERQALRYRSKNKYQQEAKMPIYTPKGKLPVVEINAADTLLLVQIKGIGPAFARRIVAYRARLGGFYKKEQLREVFGLDSMKYEEIKGQVTVDSQAVLKININTAEDQDLKKIIYLNYKQRNAIIQYRKQHGNYAIIADLNKVAILSAEIIAKIAPYISFDHD